MREERNQYKTLFVWTVLILVVLVILVAYLLWVRPAINGYVIQKQMEASDFVIATIINQVQQQGYVQLNVGNQSLILLPYDPQQAPGQQ